MKSKVIKRIDEMVESGFLTETVRDDNTHAKLINTPNFDEGAVVQ